MYLNATIYTPVGTFEGTLNTVEASEEDLAKARDYYQKSEWTYLVMYSSTGEITLPKGVLNNSVIVYTIQDFTHQHNS